MNKREAIDRLKTLVQRAGPDRLRALFSKYNLKANPNVSGVITGVELHGRPFFADFIKMVADAQRATVGFDTTTGQDFGIPAGPTSSIDDAPTGGGFNWDSLLGWINTYANTGVNIYSTITGNNSSSGTSTTTNPNNPVLVVQPNANSGSGSNTALWVIGGAVALILIVVVVFLAMKK